MEWLYLEQKVTCSKKVNKIGERVRVPDFRHNSDKFGI